MANPQKEDGHIDIANDIAEHLAYYRLSGQEYQVLWVVWRKTWGWHKKEDWISLSQFYAMTKIKKPSIIKALNKLIHKNIVSKKANKNGVSYRFNKDFDNWKSLAKRLIVSKKANGVSKKANKSLAKRLPTKETNTKETTTKETYIDIATEAFKKIWFKNFKTYEDKYPNLNYNLEREGIEEWISSAINFKLSRKEIIALVNKTEKGWNLFIHRWLGKCRPNYYHKKDIDQKATVPKETWRYDPNDPDQR